MSMKLSLEADLSYLKLETLFLCELSSMLLKRNSLFEAFQAKLYAHESNDYACLERSVVEMNPVTFLFNKNFIVNIF